MYEISKFLTNYDCYFTPYYGDSFLLKKLHNYGFLDFTVMGKPFQQKVIEFVSEKNLKLDFEGRQHNYDLIVTCSDLVVQKNIKGKKTILVQEGMTDPETILYYLVRLLKLPRYLASTAATGLSDSYDAFCIASYGYKEHFMRKGVSNDKLVISGIPNFDNVKQFLKNDFSHKNYVLAATSDARETFKLENRKKFILNALKIADGRKLIFKLHPNENHNRAIKEINKYAPGALVFSYGNTNHLIANCDVLVTKYSSVVYIGLALGKEVYSDFDLNELKQMMPIQNSGKSALNISHVCRIIIEGRPFNAEQLSMEFTGRSAEEITNAGKYYDVPEGQYFGAVTNA
jgi:hypothetical protein